MPRPIFFSTRSGRFVNKGTDDISIIDNQEKDLVYRIHNTSKLDSLNVNLTKNASPPTHELVAGGSIDLLINKGDALFVGPGKGVYDLLKNAGTVRSGTFMGDEATIALLGNKDCMYRIINSSEVKDNIIEVLADGVTKAEILPESSVDVVLNGNVTVKKLNPTSLLKIEGVFDLLAEF